MASSHAQPSPTRKLVVLSLSRRVWCVPRSQGRQQFIMISLAEFKTKRYTSSLPYGRAASCTLQIFFHVMALTRRQAAGSPQSEPTPAPLREPRRCCFSFFFSCWSCFLPPRRPASRLQRSVPSRVGHRCSPCCCRQLLLLLLLLLSFPSKGDHFSGVWKPTPRTAAAPRRSFRVVLPFPLPVVSPARVCWSTLACCCPDVDTCLVTLDKQQEQQTPALFFLGLAPASGPLFASRPQSSPRRTPRTFSGSLLAGTLSRERPSKAKLQTNTNLSLGSRGHSASKN